MTHGHYEDLSALIGKTLRAVTQNGRESIHFEADTGERWEMFHDEPDCNDASVEIEDVVGDLQDLVGFPIVMAEGSTNADKGFTWTFYKLATAKGYVTIRWCGSSNGYYSEMASFHRIAANGGQPDKHGKISDVR